MATLEQIAANGANLAIPMYVKKLPSPTVRGTGGEGKSLPEAWAQWQTDGRVFWQQMDDLVETLGSRSVTGGRQDEHA